MNVLKYLRLILMALLINYNHIDLRIIEINIYHMIMTSAYIITPYNECNFSI